MVSGYLCGGGMGYLINIVFHAGKNSNNQLPNSEHAYLIARPLRVGDYTVYEHRLTQWHGLCSTNCFLCNIQHNSRVRRMVQCLRVVACDWDIQVPFPAPAVISDLISPFILAKSMWFGTKNNGGLLFAYPAGSPKIFLCVLSKRIRLGRGKFEYYTVI